MKKKPAIAALFAVCLIPLASTGFTSEPSLQGANDGRELVQSFEDVFRMATREGTSGFEEVSPQLQKLMARLRFARGSEQIDEIFFDRYKRLLVIVTLIMMDRSFDEEGILDDLIGGQFRSFVEDVTSEKCVFPSRSAKMLAALVDAIDQEVQKLRSYR